MSLAAPANSFLCSGSMTLPAMALTSVSVASSARAVSRLSSPLASLMSVPPPRGSCRARWGGGRQAFLAPGVDDERPTVTCQLSGQGEAEAAGGAGDEGGAFR